MTIVTLFLSGCFLTFCLGFPAHRLLSSYNVIDKPNERSSHNRPTARGGGIAILFALFACGVWIAWLQKSLPLAVVLGLALLLAVISFIDDLKSVGPGIRFGCHFLAALVALAVLDISPLALDLSGSGGVLLPVLLSWGLCFLWIAGYTNAFNFMDGINGIAGGQALITGLGMVLLTGLSTGDFQSTPGLFGLVVAGAALGFLPHNFPRARMFMGDVGSAPLGLLLAVLLLWSAKTAGWWLLIPLALLHANYVLDTGITLTRRILRGERWYEAHREHFYQRLIRSGKSHPFVTGIEMTLQLVVLGLMILYLKADAPFRVGLIATVVLVWLLFFAYCEVQFRQFVNKAGARGAQSAKR